jgi:phosphoribosylanthranilate isomerase
VGHHLRIKICGITNAEDARQAALLGANAIGLNFHRPSPRSINEEQAESILRELPPFVEPVAVLVNHTIQGVYELADRLTQKGNASHSLQDLSHLADQLGICFNQTLQQLCEVADHFGICLVQVHGKIPEPEDVLPFRVVPAFPVCNGDGLRSVGEYVARARERGCLPTAIMVDGHSPGQFGGTGQTAAWNLLADFAPGVPLVLAGGLTPENVAEAVRIVRPYAVDVASGVESSPGRKDVEKMKRFIDNARSAAG